MEETKRSGIVRAAFDRVGVVALVIAVVLLFAPSIAAEARHDYSPKHAPPWFWTRLGSAVTPDLFGVVGALVVIIVYIFVTSIRQRNEAYADNDELKRQRAAERERPMDESHASWLRNIASSLQTSVEQNTRARYGDAHQTASFRRHFPELIPLLDEWDRLPSQIKGASSAALSSVRASPDDPWTGWYSGDGIFRYGKVYIERFLRSAEAPPAAFALIDHGDEGGLVLVQGNQTSGSVLRDIPAPVSDADRAEAEEQVRQLKAWMAGLHGSAPVVAWREMLDRQDSLRVELVRRLQAIRHATTLDRKRCGPECEPL